MTLNQNAKLLMYKVVRNFLSLFQTMLGNLPGYQENFTKLDNNISAIEATAVQQEIAANGFSDLKKDLKTALVNIALDVSRKLAAFATNTHDLILLREIDYSETDLSRSSDEDLLTRTKLIYDRGFARVEELTTYLVTPALMTSFLSAYNSFRNVIPSTRTGITNLKQCTIMLSELFRETDAVLDTLDTIVGIVRSTQPDFCLNYNEKRKLPNSTHSHYSMKGIIKDGTSLTGIKGVSIVLSMNGTTINKTSADKGGFIVKTLTPGLYKISASKVGYKPEEVTIPVNDGELAEVEILLMKS